MTRTPIAGYCTTALIIEQTLTRFRLNLALESYRREHGCYPFRENRHRPDLSLLVPDHLEAIPPLAGKTPFASQSEDSSADPDARLHSNNGSSRIQ